jgi:VanZ family protein
VLGTTALLLMPISAPGGVPTNLDKIAHALLMGILAVLVWRAVALPALSRGLLSALATIAYAGGMELVQGMTPDRTPELADVLAGGAGAAVAIAIVVVAASRGRPR